MQKKCFSHALLENYRTLNCRHASAVVLWQYVRMSCRYRCRSRSTRCFVSRLHVSNLNCRIWERKGKVIYHWRIIWDQSFRQSCTVFGQFLPAFSNFLRKMTFLSVYSNFPNYKILTNDLCDLDPLTCPELNLPTTTWLCADKGSPPRTPPPSQHPPPLATPLKRYCSIISAFRARLIFRASQALLIFNIRFVWSWVNFSP